MSKIIINNGIYDIINLDLLKNRSKYFNALFTNGCKETTEVCPKITIPTKATKLHFDIILNKLQDQPSPNLDKFFGDSVNYFIIIDLLDFIDSEYITKWISSEGLNKFIKNASYLWQLLLYYYYWLSLEEKNTEKNIEFFQNTLLKYTALKKKDIVEIVLKITKDINKVCKFGQPIDEDICFSFDNLIIDLYSISDQITYISYPKLSLSSSHSKSLKPGTKLITDYTEFKHRYDHITHNIFPSKSQEDWSWENVILSGGIMHYLVSNVVSLDDISRSSDLDLFMYGSDKQQRKKSESIYNYLKKKFNDNIFFVRRGFVITAIIRDPANITSNPIRNIQIIYTKFMSLYEILNNFDNTYVQICYQNGYVLTTRKFIKYYRYFSSKICKSTNICRHYKIFRGKLNIIPQLNLTMCIDHVSTKKRYYQHVNHEEVFLDLKENDNIKKQLHKYYYPLPYEDNDRVRYLIKNLFNCNIQSSWYLPQWNNKNCFYIHRPNDILKRKTSNSSEKIIKLLNNYSFKILGGKGSESMSVRWFNININDKKGFSETKKIFVTTPLLKFLDIQIIINDSLPKRLFIQKFDFTQPGDIEKKLLVNIQESITNHRKIRFWFEFDESAQLLYNFLNELDDNIYSKIIEDYLYKRLNFAQTLIPNIKIYQGKYLIIGLNIINYKHYELPTDIDYTLELIKFLTTSSHISFNFMYKSLCVIQHHLIPAYFLQSMYNNKGDYFMSNNNERDMNRNGKQFLHSNIISNMDNDNPLAKLADTAELISDNETEKI